jgi:hypothetical protein
MLFSDFETIGIQEDTIWQLGIAKFQHLDNER